MMASDTLSRPITRDTLTIETFDFPATASGTIRSASCWSGWSATRAEAVLYLYEEHLEREEMPATATVERLLKLVA